MSINLLQRCLIVLIMLLVVAFVRNNVFLTQNDQHDDTGSARTTLRPRSGRTTTTKNKNKKRRSRVAVVHVGPHATGTTLLQTSLRDFAGMLETSGHAIPPRTRRAARATSVLAAFLREDGKISNDETWEEFVSFLERARERGRHVVFASEELDRPDVDASWLVEALETKGGFRTKRKEIDDSDVRIVADYRRAYEWLRALYHATYARRRASPFPDFVTWIRDLGVDSAHWRHPLQVSQVVERYDERFSDVRILNFHDASHRTIAEQFFCDILSGAPIPCRMVKKKKEEEEEDMDLEPHRVLLEALRDEVDQRKNDLDMVPDPLSVDELAKEVARRLDEQRGRGIDHDHPWDCLEWEQLDLLLQITADEERQLLPDFFRAEELETTFRAWLKRVPPPLCAISVPELLKDEDWNRFFNSLLKRMRWINE